MPSLASHQHRSPLGHQNLGQNFFSQNKIQASFATSDVDVGVVSSSTIEESEDRRSKSKLSKSSKQMKVRRVFELSSKGPPILLQFTSLWIQAFLKVDCSHQCSQIQSAIAGWLKYLAFKSEEKCQWIKFYNISDCKWLKKDLYSQACKYKLVNCS